MSISINYLRQLPIENFSINTIPLAILILGLAEFFLFHVTLDWGQRIYHFFTRSSISNKSQHGFYKNQICSKQPSFKEKIFDGSMCREEVEIVLKSLGIFCHHHEDLQLQERLNSDNLVNFFEESKPSLDEVKEAFDVFDENKDGFVDASELQRVLLALGLNKGLELENCKSMIRVYDENKDGRIDFEEFVKFMESIDF